MRDNMEPIYFSKIEYTESMGSKRSTILLNLIEKELSYQVFDCKKQSSIIKDNDYYIVNGQTYDQEVIFSYGMKLCDEQMEKLLPYCNALDFEPYRNKEMSMEDKGYMGYRDERCLHFVAITNSYIPKLELPMTYYYDEEHIWPSEKLYRYLVKTFFENNKKLKGWEPTYGGSSLFFSGT